jgi:hypothetical protein
MLQLLGIAGAVEPPAAASVEVVAPVEVIALLEAGASVAAGASRGVAGVPPQALITNARIIGKIKLIFFDAANRIELSPCYRLYILGSR